MFSLRRSAASSSRRLLRQSPRRLDSTSHGHDAHAHDAHHSGPASEPFGGGFYMVVAAVPVTFAVYKFTYSDSSSKPLFEQAITKYSDFKDEWDRRGTLHTNMIEQAAHDRNLFQSEPVDTKVELRFPEVFNTGSPHNVIAGQGGADLTELIAHYEKKNQELAKMNKKRYEDRERAEAAAAAAKEE